ncbi:hypothetical protein ANCCAN_18089 [Ancylostoma caninum]|uniref:Uncharacterized protein n=1 Tax=Ancylostoma caninum TaxID=29170 RepID=A0A368FZ64_ANCCA|nr:hypothetical protein ANCCAN_18089 [Ancylostoma caninum]
MWTIIAPMRKLLTDFCMMALFKKNNGNVKLDFTGSKTEYRDVYGFLKEAGIELGEKMKNTLSKDLNMKPEHIGCYFDQGKKKATCVLKLKDTRQ